MSTDTYYFNDKSHDPGWTFKIWCVFFYRHLIVPKSLNSSYGTTVPWQSFVLKGGMFLVVNAHMELVRYVWPQPKIAQNRKSHHRFRNTVSNWCNKFRNCINMLKIMLPSTNTASLTYYKIPILMLKFKIVQFITTNSLSEKIPGKYNFPPKLWKANTKNTTKR